MPKETQGSLKEAAQTDRDTIEIPSTLRRSDPHAQEIYEAALKSAIEEYGEGETAYRVAWAAVKNEYEKQGDRWVKKETDTGDTDHGE